MYSACQKGDIIYLVSQREDYRYRSRNSSEESSGRGLEFGGFVGCLRGMVVTLVFARNFELGVELQDGLVLIFGTNTGLGRKLMLLLIELISLMSSLWRTSLLKSLMLVTSLSLLSLNLSLQLSLYLSLCFLIMGFCSLFSILAMFMLSLLSSSLSPTIFPSIALLISSPLPCIDFSRVSKENILDLMFSIPTFIESMTYSLILICSLISQHFLAIESLVLFDPTSISFSFQSI